MLRILLVVTFCFGCFGCAHGYCSLEGTWKVCHALVLLGSERSRGTRHGRSAPLRLSWIMRKQLGTRWVISRIATYSSGVQAVQVILLEENSTCKCMSA